jgi:hypothetical protein
MNIDRASALYRGLKWALLAWLLSFFLLLYFGITRSLEGSILQAGVFMLPGVLYVVALGLTVSTANSLNRFGPKYALPAVLLPIAGLAVSILRVRDHLLRARLGASGVLEESVPVVDE